MESREIKFKRGILWINPTHEDLYNLIDVTSEPDRDDIHIRIQLKTYINGFGEFGRLGATYHPKDTPVQIALSQPTQNTQWKNDYTDNIVEIARKQLGDLGLLQSRL